MALVSNRQSKNLDNIKRRAIAWAIKDQASRMVAGTRPMRAACDDEAPTEPAWPADDTEVSAPADTVAHATAVWGTL